MTENDRVAEIRSNLEDIRCRIDEAAGRAGRSGADISLMAVSKTKPVEDIRAAYDAGQRLFGENRILEAEEKFEQLPEDAEMHMIGHLQRNKAAAAARAASCVQSIDKLSTASELNKKASALGKTLDFLIEINTSEEASKSGYRGIDGLRADIEKYLDFSNLRLRGLMTMAPFTDDEDAIRRSFRTLAGYFDEINRETGGMLDTLSMGMSSDFEIAIEEGSTLVRVGTAIFGSRNY